MTLRRTLTVDLLNSFGEGSLPGDLGVAVVSLEEGVICGRMPVTARHMAPNGFLHAASVIALADTMAGYGCVAHLPEGATGFTTVEMKSNFVGTAREGTVTCKAVAQHLGRTTQLWDATVCDAAGKTVALFRCTQFLLRGGPAMFPDNTQ